MNTFTVNNERIHLIRDTWGNTKFGLSKDGVVSFYQIMRELEEQIPYEEVW